MLQTLHHRIVKFQYVDVLPISLLVVKDLSI